MSTRLHKASNRMLRAGLVTAGALLLLGVGSLEAQRTAVPRGGGGGGAGAHSSAPSAGGGAHRPPGGSAVPRPGGGSSYPHRPTGTPPGGGHYHPPSYRYYPPYYYWGYPGYSSWYWGYPYYGYPSRYWLSFSFGYPYYGYPYGYYQPYSAPVVVDPVPYVSKNDSGALSLKVRPKNAEVWVDGRYLGAAKSYDGTPRYLWLPPGHYDLVLYSPGYANFESEVEVVPSEVLKFEVQLQEGVGERPVAQRYAPPEDAYTAPPESSDDAIVAPYSDNDARPEPGRLQLDVRPADASVYVDGRFVGTGRDVSGLRSPLLVEPGEHVVQVIHPDYASREVEVDLDSGELENVEVVLERR